MAGLVPAIHVGACITGSNLSAVGRRETRGILNPPCPVTAWMPGTSPGMTGMARVKHPILARWVNDLGYIRPLVVVGLSCLANKALHREARLVGASA
jgi:hypothetical protein